MQQGRSNVRWSPVLDGADLHSALQTVQGIVAALSDPRSPSLDTASVAPLRDPSLASGYAGLALFFGYLSKARLCSGCNIDFLPLLNRAAQAVNDVEMTPSLYRGVTGIAWAVEHLQERSAVGEEDSGELIDVFLVKYLRRRPWELEYDLIDGLVGFGVYLLERWPRPSARECLVQIVHRLSETARRTRDGTTWWTSPLLLKHTRAIATYPNGYYNAGVAHGVPGVVGLLAQMCALGIADKEAKSLLDEAVAWLLAQRQEFSNGSCLQFPSCISAEGHASPARLAWCYGDLGIAVTLLQAARCLGVTAWEQEAITIAERAAMCPPGTAGIVDAGLCHGAAGVAHLLNRLYQLTGNEMVAERARFWFRETLRMKCEHDGNTGFVTLSDQKRWFN